MLLLRLLTQPSIREIKLDIKTFLALELRLLDVHTMVSLLVPGTHRCIVLNAASCNYQSGLAVQLRNKQVTVMFVFILTGHQLAPHHVISLGSTNPSLHQDSGLAHLVLVENFLDAVVNPPRMCGKEKLADNHQKKSRGQQWDKKALTPFILRGKKPKEVRFGLPCERQCIERFVVQTMNPGQCIKGLAVQKMNPNVVEDPTACLFISKHIAVAAPSNFNLSNITSVITCKWVPSQVRPASRKQELSITNGNELRNSTSCAEQDMEKDE